MDPAPRHTPAPASSLTRRQALRLLGSGALAASAGSWQPPAAAAAAPATPAVTLALREFPLAAVRLLDGPFRAAQNRNEAYLLKLEPDRLLHNFRVNAGLTPKAPVYGGWESVPTWADIRAHGHTLGHYLTAAALQFAATGHAELKQRVDYLVGELQECQAAGKSGLVCAFPDGPAQIENGVAGRRVTGVPWYTLHKIFAGLRDAHALCRSAPARGVLVKLADWAVAVTQGMTEDQFQRMLGVEHGGMNEVLADVFALTRDERHLVLAERFCHQALLQPLAEGRDTLNGLHSNTQIPKVVGFERLHQLTGKPHYHAAAEFFWNTVTRTRSFATGGNGDNEHFFPITEFARHLPSAKTMETCCSHNMLRLTRLLFAHRPTAAYADFYERVLFNAILGSQDPDTGMMTYFQSTRPGYRKLFCTPFDSFWCCTGTGIENHAKYGDSIYFQGPPDAAAPASLYVNLFISSTLDWPAEGIALRQTTSFPEAGRTRLEFTVTTPRRLAVHLRHPAWAPAASCKVNGVAAESPPQPGSFCRLERLWKTGDVIEWEVPLTLRLELLPGTTDTAAAVYGPLALVGALGDPLPAGADLHVNERTIGSVFNEPVSVPHWVGSLSDIPNRIKPGTTPLTFRTEGVGRPDDVTLVPYYRLAHERYNLYWHLREA